ncbi:hypothetical protein HRbin23_00983 [bacterium HR23]|nr:hypothetical protein HRbin23_00983 [bacterium HR23]
MAQTTVLRIEGLTCDLCGKRVADALRRLPGVVRVEVDWRSGRCQVSHEDGVTIGDLVETVANAARGTWHQYTATPVP